MGFIKHLDLVQSSSKVLFSPDQIDQGISYIAQQINNDYNDKSPIILCVVIGGITTLGHLLTKLSINLTVDYIHVSRYRGKNVGSELVWKVMPEANLAGRDVIIVDDILDGGITLQAIYNYCSQQQAKTITSAVLLDKFNSRSVGGLPTAEYTALKLATDDYVFGFGMDYYNYLRNVNGIFAVSPELVSSKQAEELFA